MLFMLLGTVFKGFKKSHNTILKKETKKKRLFIYYFVKDFSLHYHLPHPQRNHCLKDYLYQSNHSIKILKAGF